MAQPVSWFERVAVIAIGVVTATLVTVAFVVQGQGWATLQMADRIGRVNDAPLAPRHSRLTAAAIVVGLSAKE
jgi:hypothetical protein